MSDLVRNPNCWFSHAKAQIERDTLMISLSSSWLKGIRLWSGHQLKFGQSVDQIFKVNNLSRLMRKSKMWLPNRFNIHRAVQAQMARGCFDILDVESR